MGFEHDVSVVPRVVPLIHHSVLHYFNEFIKIEISRFARFLDVIAVLVDSVSVSHDVLLVRDVLRLYLGLDLPWRKPAVVVEGIVLALVFQIDSIPIA